MGLINALLPVRCDYCGSKGATVCVACARDLPWNRCACRLCALPLNTPGTCTTCLESSPPFDVAFAAFQLDAPVQSQIHALKYHAQFRHAQVLGTLMAQRLAARSEPLPALLIPVPLHATRLRRRGYNQSQEFGRVLAPMLNLRLDATVARRVRATEDQIGKSAAERRRNLKGAFAITRPLAGLHVALLDDVMTTGATLSELARVCRKAGAAKIEAWAVCRAPLEHSGPQVTVEKT